MERIETSERNKEQVNDLEWRSRRLNLEVHGIRPTENENLLTKLNEVAKLLDVPDLAEQEVVSAHRLLAKPDKIPGAIVRFARQATRDEWLNKRSKLKGARLGIFIQENTTKQNKALLFAAKEWSRTNSYKYAWHSNGKILLRRNDGERTNVVRSE